MLRIRSDKVESLGEGFVVVPFRFSPDFAR